jgi:predicted  nucleic acid-binding Zn-ribbon protein
MEKITTESVLKRFTEEEMKMAMRIAEINKQIDILKQERVELSNKLVPTMSKMF